MATAASSPALSPDPVEAAAAAAADPSTSPQLLPVSREPSFKRGRGFSTSSSTSYALHSQRPFRVQPSVSPDATHRHRPSNDQPTSRRPSTGRAHSRQASCVQDIPLHRSRSNESHVASPSLSPEKSFVRPELSQSAQLPAQPPSVNGRRSRAPSTATSPIQTVVNAGESRSTTAASAETVVHVSDARSEAVTVPSFVHEALHDTFVLKAGQLVERVINSIKKNEGWPEPDLERLCGVGSDRQFDNLIVAIGYSMRNEKTGDYVEQLITWRNNMMDKCGQPPAMSRSPSGGLSSPSALPRVSSEPAMDAVLKVPPPVLSWPSERRMAIQCIFTRVIVEILAKITPAQLRWNTAEKLAEIAFTEELKGVNREKQHTSKLESVKWKMATRLLGTLALVDLQGVQKKFVGELQQLQKLVNTKGHANRAAELELCYFLDAMSTLKLRIDQDLAWKLAAAFMRAISENFANVHGQASKEAYCRVISQLFLTLPATARPEYEQYPWTRVISLLNDRLPQLASKPKYWSIAYPLYYLLACLSPQELFNKALGTFARELPSRLRDPKSRATVLKTASRLMWRVSTTPENVPRVLDEMMRPIFLQSRKYSLAKEPFVLDPLVQLLRIVAAHQIESCFRIFLLPLANYTYISSKDVKDIRPDQLDFDKTVIAIEAFLIIAKDLAESRWPPFPTSFPDEQPRDDHILMGDSAERGHARSKSSDSFATATQTLLLDPYACQFGELVIKIALMCDVFMADPVIFLERPAATIPKTPTVSKTPIAETFSFAKRDETFSAADERHAFNELLHVLTRALPLCCKMSSSSTTPLINFLCKCLSQPDERLAKRSASALKAIARQGSAEIVAERFSIFALSLESQSPASDGWMSTSHNLDKMLKLYIELLEIWVQSLQLKPGQPESQNRNLTTTERIVDTVESQGLFFLCSHCAKIRDSAIQMLKMVTLLDATLEQRHDRIYDAFFNGGSSEILDWKDGGLSVLERSRLQQGIRDKGQHQTLADICSGTKELDVNLWYRIFPRLIKASFEACPVLVTQTREDVCTRLTKLQSLIEALEDEGAMKSSADANHGRSISGSSIETPQPNSNVIEQWKLYLIFACTTVTKASNNTNGDAGHLRKLSKNFHSAQNKIECANSLLTQVVPFLSSRNPAVRNATAIGLGTINVNLYKPLLQCLREVYAEDGKHPYQQMPSSPSKVRSLGRYSPDIVRVYKLTARFLQSPNIRSDRPTMVQVSSYTRDLSLFLQNSDVKSASQQTRIHFCGLTEALYMGIMEGSESQEYMSFQDRRASFTLMEDWCVLPLPRQRDFSRAVAVELRELKNAALNAMATLCAGPVTAKVGDGTQQFSIKRLLDWIHQIFLDDGDKMHAIGRRALKGLITHNLHLTHMLEQAIERLYTAEAKCLESYLEVIVDIYENKVNVPRIPSWKVFSALLFVLGNPLMHIRIKASRLLRIVDEREQKQMQSKLIDLDVGVADKTTAVSKKAQFEFSQRLAESHAEYAFHVFSEFSKHFMQSFTQTKHADEPEVVKLHPDHKRNMVAALLPWMQTIELQLDANERPTQSSYMILVNLIEITITHGQRLHHEIQALWQALTAGPYPGNVKLILDFIIDLSLIRRSVKLVDTARQIVVFLSTTDPGGKVFESFLLQLGPQAMSKSSTGFSKVEINHDLFPYTANLDAIITNEDLGHGNSIQWTMNVGHLYMVLLVDLIVAPVAIAPDRIPILLQVVLVLWDHHIEFLQEHARQLLVHLLHESVISRLDEAAFSRVPFIEQFINLIRKHDASIAWIYEADGKVDGLQTPAPMNRLIENIVKTFGLTNPGLRDLMGSTAIEWGTSCPVAHQACRSLQIFRALKTPLTGEMANRLLRCTGQSVGDDNLEIVSRWFVELIRTLKILVETSGCVDELTIARIFWIAVACLNTIHEHEFIEVLFLVESLLKKFDLSDEKVVAMLLSHRPVSSNPLCHLTDLVSQGLRSSVCFETSVKVMNMLVKFHASDIVGPPERIIFTCVANLPTFMNALRKSSYVPEMLANADALAAAAKRDGLANMSQVLSSLAHQSNTDSDEMLSTLAEAIHLDFRPEQHRSLHIDLLELAMSLLLNPLESVQKEAPKIVMAFVPHDDSVKTEYLMRSPDALLPLLRMLQSNLNYEALALLDAFSSLPAFTVNEEHFTMRDIAMSIYSQPQPVDALAKVSENERCSFGLPQPSGWSVPAKAAYREAARNNIAVICATIGETTGLVDRFAESVVETLQQHAKEQYLPQNNLTITSQEAILAAASKGDLLEKLSDFDDFFESAPRPPSINKYKKYQTDRDRNNGVQPSHGAQGAISSFNSTQSESEPFRGPADNLYVRTTSLGSLANSGTYKLREPGVMSPSAFSDSKNPPRPGLMRSMTSPATNQRTPPLVSALPESETEPFSDEDTYVSRTSTSDTSFVQDPARPVSRGKNSFRTNVRRGLMRLTSGSKQQARPGQMEASPEVPPVPDIYRTNPKSSEL